MTVRILDYGTVKIRHRSTGLMDGLTYWPEETIGKPL